MLEVCLKENRLSIAKRERERGGGAFVELAWENKTLLCFWVLCLYPGIKPVENKGLTEVIQAKGLNPGMCDLGFGRRHVSPEEGGGGSG